MALGPARIGIVPKVADIGAHLAKAESGNQNDGNADARDRSDRE